ALEAVRLDQADRVLHQVAHAIARPAGRVAHGAPRIAVVVADHVATSGSEAQAELVVPGEHRRGRAVDQQDGGIALAPEGLRTEIDAVDAQDPLPGHDTLLLVLPNDVRSVPRSTAKEDRMPAPYEGGCLCGAIRYRL